VKNLSSSSDLQVGQGGLDPGTREKGSIRGDMKGAVQVRRGRVENTAPVTKMGGRPRHKEAGFRDTGGGKHSAQGSRDPKLRGVILVGCRGGRDWRGVIRTFCSIRDWNRS